MNKYTVTMQETATYAFEVEAESEDEAHDLAGEVFCELDSVAEHFISVEDRQVTLVEKLTDGG